MKKCIILFFILVSTIVFSACGGAQSQEKRYVDVPNTEDFDTLDIQGVDENVSVQ
ncbi:LPS-assembly lipoprotein LptE [Metaplanococcus flavidus]|uniref:Uncharacterized protein n=1 Tax=Metaplanococcus flavidus TaxID=569883 RepID=A0ABW3LFL2_9BACL